MAEQQAPHLLTVGEFAALVDRQAARQAEAVITRASVAGGQMQGMMLGALLCEMKALRMTMHFALVNSGLLAPDPQGEVPAPNIVTEQ